MKSKTNPTAQSPQPPARVNNTEIDKYKNVTSDDLRELVVNNLVKGQTIDRIATKLGIDSQTVVKYWKEYVDGQYAMPVEEQRLLHERRLEFLLERAIALIEGAMSEEFGGSNLTSALRILDKIEELQDLNKSRKHEAEAQLIALTNQQVTQMLHIFDTVKMELAQQLAKEIQATPKKHWQPEVIQGVFEVTQMEALENALG